MSNFKSFNLSKEMLMSLSRQGFNEPSKIQENVISKALKGLNLVVQSETGSGKTHCYLIPIINNINNYSELNTVIITPTNELARQVFNFTKRFIQEYPKLKIRLLSSETSESNNISSLNEIPNIIIGTPGRLKSLISKGYVKLTTLKSLILDEADMILDYGYFNEIDYIFKLIRNPQIMVFSATLKPNLRSEISKYIGSSYEIVHDENFTNQNVNHYLVDIHHKNIEDATINFIKLLNPYFLIVFASNKNTVNKLYEVIKSNKYKVCKITGELSDRERKSIFRRINNDEFQIVVASDLLSRGIDFNNISDVLSVDLPYDLSYYFHRAGRTARFNKTGNSYVFYDQDDTKKIQILINNGINFKFLSFKNNELIDGKNFIKQNRKKKEDEILTKEIKKAKYEVKGHKVKPNYKKKVKLAIEKVKRKHKREIIRKDIRKQRVERYKLEARSKHE